MSAFFAKGLEISDRIDVVTFTQVLLNEGGDYNSTTGVFTCRIPGLYFFSARIMKSSSSQLAYCNIYKNTTWIVHIETNHVTSDQWGYFSSSATFLDTLTTGDEVYIGSCNAISSFYKPDCLFSGFLIQQE